MANGNVHIKYTVGDSSRLSAIEPLWKALNEHHRSLSPFFSSRYASYTFERRLADLKKKAKSGLLTVIEASDIHDKQCVGYCICSLTEGEAGEIDSLYIGQNYRHNGIGEELMRMALQWLDERHARTIKIGVSYGNEQVFGFYEKFGFYPAQTILMQKKEEQV